MRKFPPSPAGEMGILWRAKHLFTAYEYSSKMRLNPLLLLGRLSDLETENSAVSTAWVPRIFSSRLLVLLLGSFVRSTLSHQKYSETFRKCVIMENVRESVVIIMLIDVCRETTGYLIQICWYTLKIKQSIVHIQWNCLGYLRRSFMLYTNFLLNKYLVISIILKNIRICMKTFYVSRSYVETDLFAMVIVSVMHLAPRISLAHVNISPRYAKIQEVEWIRVFLLDQDAVSSSRYAKIWSKHAQFWGILIFLLGHCDSKRGFKIQDTIFTEKV